MESREDEIILKNAEHCGHCNRNMSLPYDNEFT